MPEVAGNSLLAQSSLTATQFKVLHAVWYLEQPTLQGVKYLTNMQLARVAEAAETLARKRLVTVGAKGLSAIEATAWCANCLLARSPCKLHRVLRSQSIRNIATMRGSSGPVSYSIVGLIEKRLGFKYIPTKYKAELGNAVRLYRQALSLTRNEVAAVQAIVDQLEHMIETDKGFTTKVRYPLAVLHANFAQWYAQVPSKPRAVKENEELLGKRHRYNSKTKRWEPVNAKKSDTP